MEASAVINGLTIFQPPPPRWEAIWSSIGGRAQYYRENVWWVRSYRRADPRLRQFRRRDVAQACQRNRSKVRRWRLAPDGVFVAMYTIAASLPAVGVDVERPSQTAAAELAVGRLGGKPPIAGGDQRDRWVRLRSLAEREGCANTCGGARAGRRALEPTRGSFAVLERRKAEFRPRGVPAL